MTRAVIQFVAQDKRGDIVPGAAVEVRDSDSGALVQVWNSRTGGSLVGNPGTTDSSGLFRGYINPGRVNVSASKGTFSRTWNDVVADDYPAIASNVTFRVPSEYPTLQAAVDAAHDYRTTRGAIITVLIESGHKLTHGLLVENGDYSNVIIAAEDATVYLDADFVPTPDVQTVAIYNGGIIVGVNARMPTLACLIDAENNHGPGLFLYRMSRGRVNANAGVVNAGGYGLLVADGSSCHAVQASFAGAGYGSRVTTNSQLNAPGANFSGVRLATTPDGSSNAALDVSRGSVVNIMGSASVLTDLTNSANRGLAARRSWVSAHYADVSGSGNDGVRAEDASVISFANSHADDCGGQGLQALSGSTINAVDSTATGAGNHAVLADAASVINVRNFDGTGAATRGCLANDGGRINARNANFQQGDDDGSNDIAVINGGIIAAIGSTGGLSQTANTVTANGIIFQ